MAKKSKPFCISVLDEQMKLIRQEQGEEGSSVSEIVRRALNKYFENKQYKPRRYRTTMRRQNYETRED